MLSAVLVGDNLMLAMLAVIWLSALLSTIIANIPFTAAMLPVVAYLTATIPGAGSKALFYCLSVGAAMGGNGSLIGASANMVTAGIADRAGYPDHLCLLFPQGVPGHAVDRRPGLHLALAALPGAARMNMRSEQGGGVWRRSQ